MGARGPLPNPQRRRTNRPTIPTTALPAGGFEGPVPECPLELGERGEAWWLWAWATPQAAAWSEGDLYAIGRRAVIEDLFGAEPSKAWSSEMRELDDRFGLTPKGLAALRWTIVDNVAEEEPVEDVEKVSSLDDRRAKLIRAS